MPTTPGGTVHVEHSEEVDDDARLMRMIWVDITADGRVEPHERQLMEPVILRLMSRTRRNRKEAMQQDQAFGLIRTIANTGNVTPWVKRKHREQVEDDVRVLAEAA